MKTSPSDWVQWDVKEVLPFAGGISFQLRTVKPCVVKNEFGLILGFGTGQQEIVVTGEGEITFSCTSDVWLRPSSRVQERLQKSTEIFTSLDRPAALTPEMQAIHRMMRRNEIDRQKDREEMEKRFADRSRENARSKPAADAQKAPAEETQDVFEDAERSDLSAENETPEASNDAKADRVSRKAPSADKSSTADS